MPGPADAVAELIAAHVAGRLAPPLDALVASHVAVSDRAGRFAGDLGRLAGRALEDAAPVAPLDRDAAIARICACGRVETVPAPAPIAPDLVGLPAPLARWATRWGGAGRWRRLWFGIETRDLGGGDGWTCGLMRIGGGRTVPEHGHGGLEATLVLSGGFTDAGRSLGPGDLHLCDETTEHAPAADPEGCLCAFVAATPGFLPTHPLGRLWMRLLG